MGSAETGVEPGNLVRDIVSGAGDTLGDKENSQGLTAKRTDSDLITHVSVNFLLL